MKEPEIEDRSGMTAGPNHKGNGQEAGGRNAHHQPNRVPTPRVGLNEGKREEPHTQKTECSAKKVGKLPGLRPSD